MSGNAAALAFMVFLLAYTPCVATLAAQRREIGLRRRDVAAPAAPNAASVAATLATGRVTYWSRSRGALPRGS